MAQIFPKQANPLSKASIVLALVTVGGIAYAFNLFYKSPYTDRRRLPLEQPLPFSHKHHVAQLGIDCRFCHVTVEHSAFAGIPPVSTCMTCHSQIWNQSPTLEPVREAYRTGQPIRWMRVNELPDFVYFNHSIHIAKGVACTTCHGAIGEMPLSWRESSFQMRFCLQCHEHPDRFVGPPSDVFLAQAREPGVGQEMTRWLYNVGGFDPGPIAGDAAQQTVGRWLVAFYHIGKLKDCYTCHR